MDRANFILKLKEAHNLASQFEGGYSGEFFDAKEFANALGKAISEFESGDNKVAKDLWLWFAPTTAWDDFTHSAGKESLELGNAVFEELDKNRDKYGINI